MNEKTLVNKKDDLKKCLGKKKDLSILDSNEMQWKSICDNVDLVST
jgi:hypothetical protein